MAQSSSYSAAPWSAQMMAAACSAIVCDRVLVGVGRWLDRVQLLNGGKAASLHGCGAA